MENVISVGGLLVIENKDKVMILIAESGSTKTDWVLIDESNEKQYFKTIGFNPFFSFYRFNCFNCTKKQGINSL